MAEAAFSAVVRGRVQGVNFRSFVQARGRMLGLAGYARNLSDGRSVEVVVEGPRDKLERLIDHLHDGPGMARVEAVEVEWRDASGEYQTFEVRY